MLVQMSTGTNIIKVKKMNVGSFIQQILKQLKSLLNGIYGYIILLTKYLIIIPQKFNWQKKHLENQTGTINSHKPVKIRKTNIKKNYETWK